MEIEALLTNLKIYDQKLWLRMKIDVNSYEES